MSKFTLEELAESIPRLTQLISTSSPGMRGVYIRLRARRFAEICRREEQALLAADLDDNTKVEGNRA